MPCTATTSSVVDLSIKLLHHNMSDEQEAVPAGHRGGPPLYGRMIKSISSGHDRASRMRMLKLPLIFTEAKLYAGAIAQFYWLSAALEAQLRRHAKLTRTPRGLRRVRTGYAYQPPALDRYRRHRAACPQGPTYCTH